MASRKPRLATYQAGITIHRDQHDTGLAPRREPPTVKRIEEIIKEALTKEGYPEHTVRAMRTDI